MDSQNDTDSGRWTSSATPTSSVSVDFSLDSSKIRLIGIIVEHEDYAMSNGIVGHNSVINLSLLPSGMELPPPKKMLGLVAVGLLGPLLPSNCNTHRPNVNFFGSKLGLGLHLQPQLTLTRAP